MYAPRNIKTFMLTNFAAQIGILGIHECLDPGEYVQRGRASLAQTRDEPRLSGRITPKPRRSDRRMAIQERVDSAKHLFVGWNLHAGGLGYLYLTVKRQC